MEPPRETISLLITSILGGLALTGGITEIQTKLGAAQDSIPWSSIAFFLVFVSIWFRFIPGNVSHIRRLERCTQVSVYTWLLDVSVITLESMIIVFMAVPSVENPEIFFDALIVLLFIDIGWLASALRGAKKRSRPEPQWVWLWCNIPSIAVLVAVLLLYVFKPSFLGFQGIERLEQVLTNGLVMPSVAVVFGLVAFIDVYFSAPDWFGRPRSPALSSDDRKDYEVIMREAINEAKKGKESKGIPIGAVLSQNGKIIGRGHNRRVQDKNPMAHAEIECLKSAGRIKNYEGTTLFSTLMPCSLCAGAIVQFGIKKVVVGENRNFEGARSFLDDNKVQVIVLDMDECVKMLKDYIKSKPNVWKEDIGGGGMPAER